MIPGVEPGPTTSGVSVFVASLPVWLLGPFLPAFLVGLFWADAAFRYVLGFTLVVLVWRCWTVTLTVGETSVTVRNRFRTVVLDRAGLVADRTRHFDFIGKAPVGLVLSAPNGRRVFVEASAISFRRHRRGFMKWFESVLPITEGARTNYLAWY